MIPDILNILPGESYSEGLLYEYQQSMDEGKDIEKFKNLFEEIARLEPGNIREGFADMLFELVQQTPQRTDYSFNEPSDLDGIRHLKNERKLPEYQYNQQNLKNRIAGAWYGRICGCLLGKPVELIHTDELVPFLKETGNYPMKRYILASDVTDEIAGKYEFQLKGKCYPDTISCAPADDDTNYTVMAQMLIEKCGRDFKSSDIAQLWIESQPRTAYCTAERTAYLNFTKGFAAPESAIYKNPYREWIGAQIRGDYYGYINPGQPEAAAEMAWKDASVSHIKNGIYGEMFVAAMIACAAVTDDLEEIIRGGLGQIPSTSRLYASVEGLLEKYHNGMKQEECFAWIHELYDEKFLHDWCHTISNALVVSASLIYGQGDYRKSICMAVETGFDTDCNGATVGSILGMRNGFNGIDNYWIEPVHGTLETNIAGCSRINLDEAIEKTLLHTTY